MILIRAVSKPDHLPPEDHSPLISSALAWEANHPDQGESVIRPTSVDNMILLLGQSLGAIAVGTKMDRLTIVGHGADQSITIGNDDVVDILFTRIWAPKFAQLAPMMNGNSASIVLRGCSVGKSAVIMKGISRVTNVTVFGFDGNIRVGWDPFPPNVMVAHPDGSYVRQGK